MKDLDFALRALPRIDAVIAELPSALPHDVAVVLAREAVQRARQALIAATAGDRIPAGCDAPSIFAVTKATAEALLASPLQRVINATGLVLHTNLGRAPLSNIPNDAIGYTNLEFDLRTGERGSRTAVIAPLLTALTGAEAALALNNTAAALMTAVATFAAGREVVIARGELVEIGDSFRLPEILAASGVRLHEVGTTNRTTIDDYARAIGAETGAILKVYPSNYKIVGFTSAPPVAALVDLAHAHGLPCIIDLGSDPLSPLPLPADADTKPSAKELIARGADVVMFSGDKELGGPQAGIIVGSHAALSRIGRHPWMRAMRLDKLRLAALSDVLRAHLLGRQDTIATHRYLRTSAETLAIRARDIVRDLGMDPRVEFVATEDAVGGGAHPDTVLSGFGIAVTGDARSIETQLRIPSDGRPPVIARICQGRVVLSLRAVEPGDDRILCDAIKRSLDTP